MGVSSRRRARRSRTQWGPALAMGLLQVSKLLLILRADVERVGAQGDLHAALRIFDLARDLRRCANDRPASDTVALLWMISITRAVFRFAAQCLMLSSSVTLITTFSLVA